MLTNLWFEKVKLPAGEEGDIYVLVGRLSDKVVAILYPGASSWKRLNSVHDQQIWQRSYELRKTLERMEQKLLRDKPMKF